LVKERAHLLQNLRRKLPESNITDERGKLILTKDGSAWLVNGKKEARKSESTLSQVF